MVEFVDLLTPQLTQKKEKKHLGFNQDILLSLNKEEEAIVDKMTEEHKYLLSQLILMLPKSEFFKTISLDVKQFYYKAH